MDAFFNEQNTNVFKDEKIVIFGDRSGRHYNTYIVGWDLSDDETKNAIEKMKKKFGCGGAIKYINYNGVNNTKSINLQGNLVLKVGEHLKSLKIKNLIIKEIIN